MSVALGAFLASHSAASGQAADAETVELVETVLTFREQFGGRGFAVDGCALDALFSPSSGWERQVSEAVADRVTWGCRETPRFPLERLVVDSLSMSPARGQVWITVLDGAVSYLEAWRVQRRGDTGDWAVEQVTRSGWLVADGREGKRLPSSDNLATVATLIGEQLGLGEVVVDLRPALVSTDALEAPQVVSLPRDVLDSKRAELETLGVETGDFLMALRCLQAEGLRLPGMDPAPSPQRSGAADCADMPQLVVVTGSVRGSTGATSSPVLSVFGVGRSGIGLFTVIFSPQPRLETIGYLPSR